MSPESLIGQKVRVEARGASYIGRLSFVSKTEPDHVQIQTNLAPSGYWSLIGVTSVSVAS